MSLPCDGVPREGMEVPGMRCPKCGRECVHWIAGEDPDLKKPRPHYKCLTCRYVFHRGYPKGSRQFNAAIKKPFFVLLWRNC